MDEDDRRREPLLELVQFNSYSEIEREEFSEVIIGNDLASLYSSIWFSRWLRLVGVHSRLPFLIVGGVLWLWTIWQAVLNLSLRKNQDNEVQVGSPMWILFPLYGACSITFVRWYFSSHLRHFKGLSETQLGVSQKVAQGFARKVNINMLVVYILPLLFLISGTIKSGVAIGTFFAKGKIPYPSYLELGVGPFMIHALIEPFIQTACCFCVISPLVLFNCIVQVHNLTVRIFTSELISSVYSKSSVKINGEEEQILAVKDDQVDKQRIIEKHHKIRGELKRTEQVWIGGFCLATFFGSLFAIFAVIIMLKWRSPHFDGVTPIAILLLDIGVLLGYLLTLATVNENGTALSGHLFVNGFARREKLPVNTMLEIQYLEAYLMQQPLVIAPFGVAVNNKSIFGVAFFGVNILTSIVLTKMKDIL